MDRLRDEPGDSNAFRSRQPHRAPIDSRNRLREAAENEIVTFGEGDPDPSVGIRITRNSDSNRRRGVDGSDGCRPLEYSSQQLFLRPRRSAHLYEW
jgi:hypothetical protein